MIKENLMKVIIIIIAISFISCDTTEKTPEPEDVGMYAFKLLNTLSQTTKIDYVNSFMTIEEIRELGKNEEVVTDPDTRNQMTSMEKEEWNGDTEDDYNELKQDGEECGIKWSEIEYLDFVYELDNYDGAIFCIGDLFFKYKDNSYSVGLISIFDGNEYKLIGLNCFFEI